MLSFNRNSKLDNINELNRNVVKILEERLNEVESLLQDYREENSVLKSELTEVQVSFLF